MAKRRLGAWEFGLAAAVILAPAAFVILYARYVEPLRYPALVLLVGAAVVMATLLPLQSLKEARRQPKRRDRQLERYRIALVVPFASWTLRVQLAGKQTLDGRISTVQVFSTVAAWLASDLSWDAAVVYESLAPELHNLNLEARVVILRGILPRFPQYSVVEFPRSARTPAGVAAFLPIEPHSQPSWASRWFAEPLFKLAIALAVTGAALVMWLQPN